MLFVGIIQNAKISSNMKIKHKLIQKEHFTEEKETSNRVDKQMNNITNVLTHLTLFKNVNVD